MTLKCEALSSRLTTGPPAGLCSEIQELLMTYLVSTWDKAYYAKIMPENGK